MHQLTQNLGLSLLNNSFALQCGKMGFFPHNWQILTTRLQRKRPSPNPPVTAGSSGQLLFWLPDKVMIKVLLIQRLTAGLRLCFPSHYGNHLTAALKESQAARRYLTSEVAQEGDLTQPSLASMILQ